MRLGSGAARRVLGLVLVLLLALVPPVGAADPVETLVATPEAAALDRFDGISVEVRVTARLAAGAAWPEGAVLSANAPPGIVVEQVSGPDLVGDAVWTYRLTAMPQAPDVAVVAFRLSYAAAEETGQPAVPRVRRLALEASVRPGRDAPLAEAVTLAFETHDRPLSRGAPVRGVLVVSNLSGSPLSLDRLTALGPDFVEIALPEAPGTLPAGATRRLPVMLRLRDGAPAPPGAWLVQVEAVFSRGSGATRPEARLAAVHTLTVAPPTAAAEGVTVTLTIGGAALFEGAPLDAHLLIANAGALPVTVEAVTLAGPAFVTLSAVLDAPVTVAREATLRLPVSVAVQDGQRVRIGTWPIHVDVALSRAVGEAVETGTLTASADVDATVPGVSDVLKLLEVPTILLLPGVLVLLTWSALVALPGNAGSWLEFRSKTFWLLAVVFSIAIFFAWRQWSDVDFAVAFSLADVATLWIACILGAVALYGLYWGLMALGVLYRARLEPREGDSPLRLLGKLHGSGLPFYLPAFGHAVGGQTQRLYLLGHPERDGRRWAIPEIVARPGVRGEAARTALQAIELANNEPDDFGGLLRLLKVHGAVIALEWGPGPVRGPLAVDAVAIGPAGEPQSPLRVSPA